MKRCSSCGLWEMTQIKPVKILGYHWNATCDHCGEWNFVKEWDGPPPPPPKPPPCRRVHEGLRITKPGFVD